MLRMSTYGQTEIEPSLIPTEIPIGFKKMEIQVPTFEGKAIHPSVLGVIGIVLVFAFPKIRKMLFTTLIAKTIYTEVSKMEEFKTVRKEIIAQVKSA